MYLTHLGKITVTRPIRLPFIRLFVHINSSAFIRLFVHMCNLKGLINRMIVTLLNRVINSDSS